METLTTNEVKDLISRASEFGITLYNMWAAEPLLREDLPEIIGHAKNQGMLTALVTNGTLLKQKAGQLEDLDYLSVSMDGLETNKLTRGVEPEQIIKGIKKAKKIGIFTAINCVITQKNIDELTELVKLSNKLDTLISFEPVYRHPEIDKETWSETKTKPNIEHREAVNKLIEMKENNYPIINSKTYLEKIKNPGKIKECNPNDMILHITADGKIKKCRAKNQVLGDYRDGLEETWEESREQRKEITNECDGCPFFGYVEANLMRKLKPEPIINATKYI